MLLSVVVPCYNEAENIPLILKRFDEVIKRDDIEVVLVDNGSTDDSPEILSRLLPNYVFARTIRVEVNQGYGYGIVQGLNVCKGRFIGWTHADMQTDPADLIKALDIIERNGGKESLYIKGRRKGRPLADRFFTFGMSVFETLYMGAKLFDINAQPNVLAETFMKAGKIHQKIFPLIYMRCIWRKKAGSISYVLTLHSRIVSMGNHIGATAWHPSGSSS